MVKNNRGHATTHSRNQKRGTVAQVSGNGDCFIFSAMAHTVATASLNRYAPQTPHVPMFLRTMAQQWSQALKREALAMIWSDFVRRMAQ
jgi:hypothetical protein